MDAQEFVNANKSRFVRLQVYSDEAKPVGQRDAYVVDAENHIAVIIQHIDHQDQKRMNLATGAFVQFSSHPEAGKHPRIIGEAAYATPTDVGGITRGKHP